MRAVIFANGHLTDLEYTRARLRPDDLIICADGGTRHALALGLHPHLLIGDLDSIDPADLDRLQAWGAAIEQHPVDKNATDLQLALEAAPRQGADEVLVLAALGGRLDQQFANLLLLASPAFADLHLSLADGAQTAWIVRDRLDVVGRPGDTVSALALSAQVEGLSYGAGLRWPLLDFTLSFGSTRGISNELITNLATITIRSGVLLVVHIPAGEPDSNRQASS